MTICAACGKKIQDGITIRFKDILGKRVFFHFDYECEKDNQLHCPDCGYPQYCDCPICLSKVPAGFKPHKSNRETDAVSCSNCGFTAHPDFWLTLSEEIFLKVDRR